jgi:hypothetical protein
MFAAVADADAAAAEGEVLHRRVEGGPGWGGGLREVIIVALQGPASLDVAVDQVLGMEVVVEAQVAVARVEVMV